MSKIVQLNEYRELKQQLTNDLEFRSFVKSIIDDLDNTAQNISFGNYSNYEITSVTFNGMPVPQCPTFTI
jgi:hypothetical protein